MRVKQTLGHSSLLQKWMCGWMGRAQDPRDYLEAARVPQGVPLQSEIVREQHEKMLHPYEMTGLEICLKCKNYLGMDYKPWWGL